MFEKTNLISYAELMRIILSSLLVFFMSCPGAETVYKTVDDDGNIIFTDKPSENSEEIKLRKLQTIDNPNPGKAKPYLPKEDKSPVYETIVVSKPVDGSAVRSNNGNVTISISLEPALRSGHEIIIAIDGKEVGSGNSVSLQNVDRGTHSVSASVIDGNGKKIISTSSSFSLLRN